MLLPGQERRLRVAKVITASGRRKQIISTPELGDGGRTNPNPQTETLKIIAILCGTGLLISIVLATCGLGLGIEFL